MEDQQAPPAGPTPDELAAMQQTMNANLGITLEEAHAEAVRLVGEQQVTIRVLTQRVQMLTLMVNAQSQPQASPPAPPATPPGPNRAARRANGKSGPKALPVG